MAQIVCLSTQRWQRYPNRTQRLLTGIPGHEVLFFEPFIPLFSGQERKLRRAKNGWDYATGVTLYTLPSDITAGEDYSTRAPAQFRRIGAYVRDCMARKGFRAPVLWITSPIFMGLLKEIPNSGVVYDCDRNWEEQVPGSWEAELCNEANVVFAASPLLQERLQPYCLNLQLLPNGYDRALFAAESQIRRTPADFPVLNWPVFGVLGSCLSNHCLSSLLYVAKTKREWNFVIAGSVPMDLPELPNLTRQKNIYLLGDKTPNTYPSYLNHFDFCLSLPSQESEDGVLPEAFYACLGTGRPVIVLTELPEDAQYNDVAYHASFGIELLDACNRALLEENELMRNARLDYAAWSDWSARTEEVVRVLQAATLI